MNTKQAKRGGEFGANGEWYEGGQFINTVAENAKQPAAPSYKGGQRMLIEPGVWAPYDGRCSLYVKLSGVFGKVVDGQMVIVCSDQTLNYFGATRSQVEQWAARYNAGERWL